MVSFRAGEYIYFFHLLRSQFRGSGAWGLIQEYALLLPVPPGEPPRVRIIRPTLSSKGMSQNIMIKEKNVSSDRLGGTV